VPWAIRPEALEAILAIAAREDISQDVVAAAMTSAPRRRSPRSSARSSLDNRDRHRPRRRGHHPVEGPIVRYASLFSDVSGATSTETLSTDLTTALGDDPPSEAILLEIDSPAARWPASPSLPMLYARPRAEADHGVRVRPRRVGRLLARVGRRRSWWPRRPRSARSAS
jgi:hypothetical protein